jgi:hypothetical protein
MRLGSAAGRTKRVVPPSLRGPNGGHGAKPRVCATWAYGLASGKTTGRARRNAAITVRVAMPVRKLNASATAIEKKIRTEFIIDSARKQAINVLSTNYYLFWSPD